MSAVTYRIVFLHGIGDSADVWQSVASSSALSQYDKQLVQFPGFDGLPWNGERGSVISWICSRASSIIMTPSIIVGHSMGGPSERTLRFANRITLQVWSMSTAE